MVRIIVALMLLATPAAAHDWYPRACCSDKDCHPVNCDEVSVSQGYYKWRGLTFPKDASYPSKDGGCHVCTSFGKLPVCLFYGGTS